MSAGSVRINPVGLKPRSWALQHAMVIVRLSGRDAVRLLTDVRERAERVASSDARGVGERPLVVPAWLVDIVTKEGARHSAADRTGVRRGRPSEGESRLAS